MLNISSFPKPISLKRPSTTSFNKESFRNTSRIFNIDSAEEFNISFISKLSGHKTFYIRPESLTHSKIYLRPKTAYDLSTSIIKFERRSKAKSLCNRNIHHKPSIKFNPTVITSNLYNNKNKNKDKDKSQTQPSNMVGSIVLCQSSTKYKKSHSKFNIKQSTSGSIIKTKFKLNKNITKLGETSNCNLSSALILSSALKHPDLNNLNGIGINCEKTYKNFKAQIRTKSIFSNKYIKSKLPSKSPTNDKTNYQKRPSSKALVMNKIKINCEKKENIDFMKYKFNNKSSFRKFIFIYKSLMQMKQFLKNDKLENVDSFSFSFLSSVLSKELFSKLSQKEINEFSNLVLNLKTPDEILSNKSMQKYLGVRSSKDQNIGEQLLEKKNFIPYNTFKSERHIQNYYEFDNFLKSKNFWKCYYFIKRRSCVHNQDNIQNLFLEKLIMNRNYQNEINSEAEKVNNF